MSQGHSRPARPREKLLALGPGGAGRRRADRAAAAHRPAGHWRAAARRSSCSTRFGGLAGLLHADADELKRVKGLGPAKRAEVAAVLELARRSLAAASCRQRPVFDSPAQGQGLPALQLGAPRRTRCSRCCSSTRRPADRARGDVPRHADADQRLPARGRQARARAQRRGGDPGAQPSVGRGRAVARRRVPDADAEERARAGRRARARPPGGRPAAASSRSPSGACCDGAPIKGRARSHELAALRAAAARAAARAPRRARPPSASRPPRERRERDLFADAVGPVVPLRTSRAARAPARPRRAAVARQRERDERAALRRVDLRRVRRRVAARDRRRAVVSPPRHRPRRRAQAAPRRLGAAGRDRPARPAPRRGARARSPRSCARPRATACAACASSTARATARPGREPVLKAKVQALAGAAQRGARLHPGARRRRRPRRADRAAASRRAATRRARCSAATRSGRHPRGDRRHRHGRRRARHASRAAAGACCTASRTAGSIGISPSSSSTSGTAIALGLELRRDEAVDDQLQLVADRPPFAGGADLVDDQPDAARRFCCVASTLIVA